jgi:serine/threonine protein kinase
MTMPVFNRVISKLSGILQTYIGSTGRAYTFKQLLQQKEHFGRVWLATNGETRFILKDIPELIFDHYNHEIQPNLPKSRFIRVPLDVIPEQRIFVFKYLDSDLLSLVRKGTSDRNAKRILKDSLMGLAQLHEKDVVHLGERKNTPSLVIGLKMLDIKPANIMVDHRDVEEKMMVKNVQLTDLNNAAYLPNGRQLNGMLIGNEDWRSPEAAFKSKVGKPTDIYSFGLVVCSQP